MSNRSISQSLPTSPGCYLMKDERAVILYVGKAKNIRKRVSSYWRARDEKTVALVSEVADIDTIVTDTEEEALILEAQLIQAHHPKYNIDLQSPGRYAFIKLTREEYPRFMIARKVTSDGTFFGPFPSAAARNQMLRSVNSLFQLCSIKRNKKPCFRYHLRHCAGACAGLVPKDDHQKSIKSAIKFLRGDFALLIKETKELMNTAAGDQCYEKAKIYRDRLLALQKREEQKVSQPKRYDQDIINYLLLDSQIILQLFHFDRGIISGRKEFSFDRDTLVAATTEEVLRDFLLSYYSSRFAPREIIIPHTIPDHDLLEATFAKASGHRAEIIVPQKGKKKKLLELVKKNLLEKLGGGGGQLTELQKYLRLSSVPRIIDCIDISHLGGTQTVGSLVHMINGQLAKSGYRKFIIKSVEGINDFASIHEVVTRFGKRVRDGKEKKPDLLVIDGGKGQLNSALKALHELALDIPTVGLAKRLEELFLPGMKTSVILPRKSNALQLVQTLRDEAHRFAITFQRKRRKISDR
ncbi:MAG: excinuclease ABC subunit UvrC [Candidatus Uhrbacteria bacterium]|nr:excinuclease ABC subunit UvrC [Candidatus Uhrbacteria bacterium]